MLCHLPSGRFLTLQWLNTPRAEGWPAHHTPDHPSLRSYIPVPPPATRALSAWLAKCYSCRQSNSWTHHLCSQVKELLEKCGRCSACKIECQIQGVGVKFWRHLTKIFTPKELGRVRTDKVTPSLSSKHKNYWDKPKVNWKQPQMESSFATDLTKQTARYHHRVFGTSWLSYCTAPLPSLPFSCLLRFPTLQALPPFLLPSLKAEVLPFAGLLPLARDRSVHGLIRCIQPGSRAQHRILGTDAPREKSHCINENDVRVQVNENSFPFKSKGETES